mgnify:FL=1
MNFKIDRSKSETLIVNTYKIILEFMLGDADDFREEYLFISTETFNSNIPEISKFVKSILDCIEQDDRGRCGINNSEDFAQKYIKIKNWSVFCDEINNAQEVVDDFDKHTEHSDFITYSVPRDYNGWYYAYKSIEIVYYDEDGLMYNVLIEE